MSDPTRLPKAWARRLLSPCRRFLELESATSLVLIAATAIALSWANSPWSGSYRALWHTELSVTLGSWSLGRPLEFWVNDGLMTVFFLVVGLEIRCELHDGELRDLRRAAFPLVAAVGGMVVPAAIYAGLNAGRDGAAGWGIPMATDIAFAVGALGLLGGGATPAIRMLLLALAVIDDIGVILVIAIFYSVALEPVGLVVVGGGVAGVALFKVMGVRTPAAYAVPGIIVWAGVFVTGVHPAIAGVILGLLTPVRGGLRSDDDRALASPAGHLKHALHGWVAFVIVPLFALANAGVALDAAAITGDARFVFAGIVLGLVLGKPIGILVACRVGVAARVARRPSVVSSRGLRVVGILAGIGFTMSLFVAQLGFPPGPLLETAKLAIVIGSSVAAVAGWLTARLRPPA